MNAQERIAKLLEIYQLNAKVFSEKLGFDRPQVIYDILNGKTKGISEKMAIKIISAFPEVNKSWLLSGEGLEVHTMVLSPEKEAPAERPLTLEEQLSEAMGIIAQQTIEIQRLKEKLARYEKGDAIKNVG